MIFILLIASTVANGILFTFAGGAVVLGLVFSLIGWPSSKPKDSGQLKKLYTFILLVCATLTMLVMFMALTFWSARISGTLAFTSPAEVELYISQAKKLVLLGAVQGVFSLLVFRYIMPLIAGELEFSKKHIWMIASGVLLSLASGGAAWLSSV